MSLDVRNQKWTKAFLMNSIFSTSLLLLIGCGKTDSKTPIVTPPDPAKPLPSEPVSSSSAAGSILEPPGKIELPPGDIPTLTTDATKTLGSDGIEMPKDANFVAFKPEITIADWPKIQNEIEKSGKLTVVDFWSLSCQPCLEEFPGLVRLNEKFGGNVNCISVNLDFDGRKTRPPEHYQERVTAFLTQVEARFPNFICATSSDDIYAILELDSIPAVLVFDGSGKLQKKFVDAGDTVGFTYDKDVTPYVSKVIKP